MNETLQAITAMAEKKSKMVHNNIVGYLILAFYGGLFIGFGMITFILIGGLLSPTESPSMKIIQGLTFGLALCMVTIGGVDLFTGNNLVLTIGALEKRVSWFDVVKVWIVSYGGNFVGAVFCAWIFYMSGIAIGDIAGYVEKATTMKMSASWLELLFRGILCNTLVCLGVWCTYRVKSDIAKIAMIFCCIFPFIMSGFEHSIANMMIFSLAMMLPHGDVISISGAMHNLVPVTLGNIIGGAIVLGLGFWLTERVKKSNE